MSVMLASSKYQTSTLTRWSPLSARNMNKCGRAHRVSGWHGRLFCWVDLQTNYVDNTTVYTQVCLGTSMSMTAKLTNLINKLDLELGSRGLRFFFKPN